MPPLRDRLEGAATTALAERDKTPVLVELLMSDKLKVQLAQALPASIRPERFVRILLTEVRRNPELLTCSQPSFLGAIMTLAQLGLEPGPLGHGYVLPFRNTRLGTTEAQALIGYRGMVDLCYRSDKVQIIEAHEVREGDEFDYAYGSERFIHHKPGPERGAAHTFYAIAFLRGGAYRFEVLTKADVERYRARSRAKDKGPWVSDYDAMGKKTAIRRLAPTLPLTIEAASAIQEDEAREFGYATAGALDMLPGVEGQAEEIPPTEDGDQAQARGQQTEGGTLPLTGER